MNDDFKKISQLQEYDRKRIANDLHDTSLQTLAHITHQVELVSKYIDKDPVMAKLELAEVNKEIRDVIDEIRGTIFNLRPMSFDDLGLKETIERDLTSHNKRSDINYKIDIGDITLSDDYTKLQILRIVQELVRNCEKHSKAKSVLVNIYQDKELHITIEDDGIGIAVPDNMEKESNHFGRSIILERLNAIGGTMSLESKPGQGTKITITIQTENKE